MDGIKIGDVSLFLGHIPARKSLCFYFLKGTCMYPVAYVIGDENIKYATELWQEMTNRLQGVPENKQE